MVGKLDTHPVDRRIAQVAAGQHGLITRAQLVHVGLSRQAIDARTTAGRIHRIHRGVFAVGHQHLSRHGHLLAAVLTFGEDAALSHTSAAELWRLIETAAPRIHLTVPSTNGRMRRRGITFHRSALDEHEVTELDAISVTSPARTLLDLADVLPLRALERALDEADYLRLDLTALQPRHGRRGSGRLATALARHDQGATLTRSQLEERFLRMCRREALPRPDVNERVEGHQVDFSWPDRRLIVETDGHAAHGTRAAFERDRLRDAALTVAGWRVLRVTYRRLATEPSAVADQLRELL